MSELKMPMPKLPDIQIDETVYEEEPYEEEEEAEEGGYTDDAIASLIGYLSAFGLPQPWMSRKALEYKQAALDVGLAHNVSILIEKYFPQLEDKPEYAVVLSLIAYGAIVLTDRMQLQQKLKKSKKVVTPKKKVEEVKENAGPKNNENAEQ